MPVFLGIDIGTSGTKTLAMREDGEILASATEEYPLSNPKPGWSEQEPADWWKASVNSVKRVMKAAKLKPAANVHHVPNVGPITGECPCFRPRQRCMDETPPV